MVLIKVNVTKRSIVQNFASLYDPLGLLIHILLSLKVFLSNFQSTNFMESNYSTRIGL